jgi:FKBP-type peptidyl-prolyl cis-trans isomerase FkpA
MTMRKLILFVFFALLFVAACSQEPKTDEQKAFYSLGVQLNKEVSIFDLTPEEMKFVQQGLADAAAGKKMAIDAEASMPKLGELARARMAKAAEKQKEMAKPFLEKAAAEKGAKKTASGLIYNEIKAGTGVQPKVADVVKVNYTGTFVDGKEFDSSVKRGQPAKFPLGLVMPCWKEGIGMMKVGGKAKLVCPADLAYGNMGRPPIIPGGATLVFDVELLDVEAGAASKFMPPNGSAANPKMRK